MKVRLCFLLLFTYAMSYCQQQVKLEEIIDNLEIPVDIAFDYKNVMYIVEKRGKIIRIENGVKNTFLDITSIVNSAANERGLLGMAFDPNYATNGNFFVNYTNAAGSSNISRFTRSLADSISSNANTEKHLMIITQPYNNHNGGCLKFGPDGYLYIGMGDGGSGGDPGNRSQNPKERLGKMLRIDVNSNTGQYGIPDDNPYKNSQDTLEEIWAMGLRNPWRFSFDKTTGDLWIGDVGQNKLEEVDFTPASTKGGWNYGWRCYEGTEKYDFAQCKETTPFVKPVHTYATKSNGEGCSITGGYVYRGNNIPYLKGQYIYGDYCTSKIWRLKKNDCGVYQNELISTSLGAQEVSTFGEDKNGELYVAAIGSGKVYKMVPLCNFSASISSIKSARCTTSNDGQVVFDVQSSFPYTYTLTGPSTDINALKAGKYNYKLKDSLGCTSSNCFEIGIDSVALCNFSNPTEVFICEGQVGISLPTICSNVGIDSFAIYLDSMLYKTTKNLDLIIKEAGEYSFEYYKNGCKYPRQKLLTLTVEKIDSIPQFTFNGTKAIVTGPFALYQMYKDGILVSENKDGLFDVNASNFGQYTFRGISANGCLSKASNPLIISSTLDEAIVKTLLYPNPFNDVIYLKTDDIKSMSFYTMEGKKIAEQSNPRGSVPTGDFNVGLYLVKIVQVGKETWVKMVKQ